MPTVYCLPLIQSFSNQHIFYCISHNESKEEENEIKTLKIHISIYKWLYELYGEERRQNIPIGFVLLFIKYHRLPIACIPLPDNNIIIIIKIIIQCEMWKTFFSNHNKGFFNVLPMQINIDSIRKTSNTIWYLISMLRLPITIRFAFKVDWLW